MKHYNATYETSHMQHGHATIETKKALMKQCSVIMHNNAYDQVLIAF